jgi:Ca2+-binding RTX toxin-like protein
MRLSTPRLLCPALAIAAAIAAAGAPAASAENHPSVWLNEQTGVLSFTGTADNDYLRVGRTGPNLQLNIKNWTAADFSANCTEGGGLGDWVVTCPASHVQRITYEGGLAHDSFIDDTDLPAEAHGGPGIDWFHGGSGRDVLGGEGDADHLDGRGGDDVVDGGAGVDAVFGGDGHDIASWADAAGPVTASLDGAANDGTVGEGENVPADVEGLQGGSFADTLSGAAGPDTLLGGPSGDTLEGWSGDDVLDGQAGGDTLHSGAGADTLSGGTDRDSLSYAGVGQAVYVVQNGAADDGMLGEHDDVTGVEALTGSAYDDDLAGTPGDDVITGGGGGDKITPGFGDDTTWGGDGPDHVDGGPGLPDDCGNAGCTEFDTDAVYGGSGSDTIDYSSRSDDLTIALDGSSPSGGFMEKDLLTSIENANGGSGENVIYGNDAANSLTGGPKHDGIVGRKGNDYISTDAGNDYVEGGRGDDYMVGGPDDDLLVALGGSDTLWGGQGRDRVSYSAAGGGVTATIGSGASGPAGEADKIEGDVEELEGSTHADRLHGDGAANVLLGRQGADVLAGHGGADTLTGDAGADTLWTKGDGLADNAACGTEADVVNADALDHVGADCETVHH